MAKILAGTSGYSFKEWRGSFYPEKFPERQFLPYYAERLPTVELNNTFYRMPTAEAIAGWCGHVSPAFEFSVKAPQRITHIKRLKDVDDVLTGFADLVTGFGERLGVVLFQFPPQFKLNLERLRAFREVWPRKIPTALEFRHDSWDVPEVRAWLRTEGLGWVLNDSDDEQAAEVASSSRSVPDVAALDAAVGGDVLYARLRRETYSEVELATWAERLRAVTAKQVFVFFKHEVRGPGYAQFLLEKLG